MVSPSNIFDVVGDEAFRTAEDGGRSISIVSSVDIIGGFKSGVLKATEDLFIVSILFEAASIFGKGWEVALPYFDNDSRVERSTKLKHIHKSHAGMKLYNFFSPNEHNSAIETISRSGSLVGESFLRIY